MKKYFYHKFPENLKCLKFVAPNKTILEMECDPYLLFFGGRDWENVGDDLSHVLASERPRFILSLFMVVLIDQCLHSKFNGSYAVWRKITGYPK